MSESELDDVHDRHRLPQRGRLGRVAGASTASDGEAPVGVDACFAAGIAAPERPAVMSSRVPATGASGRPVAMDAPAALVDGAQIVRRTLGAADSADP